MQFARLVIEPPCASPSLAAGNVRASEQVQYIDGNLCDIAVHSRFGVAVHRDTMSRMANAMNKFGTHLRGDVTGDGGWSCFGVLSVRRGSRNVVPWSSGLATPKARA